MSIYELDDLLREQEKMWIKENYSEEDAEEFIRLTNRQAE